MQQDQIITYVVCIGAALCSVGLVVGFFSFRFAFRYLGLFFKAFVKNEQDDEAAANAQLRVPRRRIDLRAKAESVDFDSALAQAQYGQNPPVSPQAAPPPAPSPFGQNPSTPPPAPSPFGQNPSTPSPFNNDAPPDNESDFRSRLRRRGRRREHGEEYDALYGDDEGDEGLLGL